MFLSVPCEHFEGKNQVSLIRVVSKATNKVPPPDIIHAEQTCVESKRTENLVP